MCGLDLRLYILRQLPFFKSLSKEQIFDINKKFVDKGYQSGDLIYVEGAVAERLFVMADGSVKLIQSSQQGKEVLLDVLTSGDFFGGLFPSSNDIYRESAYAQTPVCVISIESSEFRNILQEFPPVALSVMDIISERLRVSQEFIRLISTATADQRVAYTLIKLSEKLGEKSDVGLLIQLPLSREDIANMTALTTETVSRIMSKFQKKTLIKTGRQWVAITNLEELKDISSHLSQ
jgi:CRP-like cAMP-binding protein